MNENLAGDRCTNPDSKDGKCVHDLVQKFGSLKKTETKTENSMCLIIKSLNKTILKSLDKENLYQIINSEASSRGLLFEKIDKGAEIQFSISDKFTRKVYGSILSTSIEGKMIYQGITKSLYDFYESNGAKNFVLLIDTIENHYLVLPFIILKGVTYDRQSGEKIYKDFHIKRSPYILSRNDLSLTEYVDNLDLLFQDLSGLSERSSKPSMFVTGYDDTNLRISKKSEILGWKNRSSKMSIGDYVFVFNTTTDKIESCFEIKSPATTQDRIWHEEKETTSPLSDPIYPYRWNAVLRMDDLGITTADIFALAPFNTDRNTFSMLIRNKFPRSLDDPQYAQFRNFLLDKIRTSEQKTISVTIEDLANTTYLPIEKLKEIEALLKEKRQIIFYGPPGTGKTFIAIQFAKYLKSKYHGD